jgi:hypothetical protein
MIKCCKNPVIAKSNITHIYTCYNCYNKYKINITHICPKCKQPKQYKQHINLNFNSSNEPKYILCGLNIINKKSFIRTETIEYI